MGGRVPSPTLGIFYSCIQIYAIMMASAAAATMAGHQPTMDRPSLPARELLHRFTDTTWHRELRAASDHLLRRRQRRNTRYDNDASSASAVTKSTSGSGAAASTASSTCLSPLQKWFVSLIEEMGLDTWERLDGYNVTSLAHIYKQDLENSEGGTGEYFGTQGERTTEMLDNHRALTDFWSDSINDGDVILLGMHGIDLAEDWKLLPTLQQLYKLDAHEAYELGGTIRGIVESLPRSYNNPILTANAVAARSLNIDGSKNDRDR